MNPSTRTHQDEHRIELSNLIIVLLCVGSLPISLFLILSNGLLVLAIEFMFVVGFMDMILTADMLNRGYAEQNFYKIFFSHLGNNRGFQATVILNCAFRAALCFIFLHEPIIILTSALASFVGPLWNTLHAFSFRDDIVLKVPTHITISNSTEAIDLDAGVKIRLEQHKDGED